MSIYVKRAIKEGIILVLLLVLLNMGAQYLIKLIQAQVRLPVNSQTIFLIMNAVIILWRGLKFIPKKMFCADCGNFLGSELRNSMPCSKCRGNIWSYTFTGAGSTVKVR